MSKQQHQFLALDEQALLGLAEQLAQLIQPCTIYLQGDLGAGKTTFSRALIKAMGYKMAVKSPTFTLVEPYPLKPYPVYHFDLYRLSEPEELEYIGIRDYDPKQAILLIEWPSKGEAYLPPADWLIDIDLESVSTRSVNITANTQQGESLLAMLLNNKA